MGLINEQKRDNSQVQEPDINSLELSPVQFSEPQAFPVSAGVPVTEDALQETLSQPAEQSITSAQFGQEEPQLKPLFSGVVQKPDLSGFSKLPQLQTEVDLAEVSPYDPVVVNSQLPTLYAQPAYTPALSQANKLLQDVTSRPQVNTQQTQIDWAKRTLENRGLFNTPDVDKPYTQSFTGWLGDVFFGTEKARREAEQGVFKPEWGGFVPSPLGLLPQPITGTFGRQGAGIFGGLGYTLSTPLNATVGAVADLNVGFANLLENFGLDRKLAEGFTRDGVLTFIPGIPKPSSILGFNFDAARKQINTLSALTGNQVADIGDPRESTETNTGRVFYNPRRKLGQSVFDDPLGLGLEIGLNIFDPLGNKLFDPAFSQAFGLLFGKVPTKAGQQTILQSNTTLQTPLEVPSTPTKLQQTPATQLRQSTVIQPNLSKLKEIDLEIERLSTINRKPQTTGDLFWQNVRKIEELMKERDFIRNLETEQLVNINSQNTRLQPNVKQPTQLQQTTTLQPNRVQKQAPTILAPDNGVATVLQDPNAIPVYDAEFVPELPAYPVNPSLPPAANPSKVVRIPISGTSVNQRLLPPAVDPSLVPPSKLAEVLPVPKSNPSLSMLKIGIGTPSTEPVTNLGQLALRPYTQVVEQIQLTNPKLLEGYSGVTWNDLKAHLSKQPKLDLSEFNVVGSELPKALLPVSVSNLSSTDLEEVAGLVQELATTRGLKQSEVDVQQLLPEALDQFNKGKRVNLSESTIVKKYTLAELAEEGVNIDAIKQKLTQKGFKFNQEEDPRILYIIFSELNKKTDLGKLQQLYDNGLIRVYESVEDIPKVTGKQLLDSKPVVDIPAPKPTIITKDDLSTAAQELAAHKQAVEAPLLQLEQLATENVDFGRRALENGGYSLLATEDITKAIQNGGTPSFLPKAFDVIPDNFRRLLQAGDFQGLQLETIRTGIDPRELIENLRLEHNRLLLTPTPVNPSKPTKALTSLPKDLYHGTALANWSPNYNLSVYGSRGELGSGLYLTNKSELASQYALARMSDNANPETLDFDLSPSVYSLQSTLERTLDARAKLPSNDDFYKRLAEGLPEELRANLLKSISRAKTTTYSGFLTKLESNLVRSGLEPTEEVLQQVQKTVSDNLRKLGYDSVYDSKSGYALVLDETKVNTIGQQALEQTDEAGAALARYNADAYSSKFFPERLTTDANLRDSSMRLLNQVRQNVDNRLAQIQQELIQRGEDYEGVLPQLTDDALTVKRPKTAAEILDDVDIDSICG